MLSISELPIVDGFPAGAYRLKLKANNDSFLGVTYRDGVSTEPVSGRFVARQYSAWGTALIIEPWDDETLSRIISHLESTGKATRATELRASLRPQVLDTNDKKEKIETAKAEILESVEAVVQDAPGCGLSIEDIEDMPKHELVDLLKKLGGSIPKNTSKRDLRDKIAEKLGIEDDNH
jgi:hypothetical protein